MPVAAAPAANAPAMADIAPRQQPDQPTPPADQAVQDLPGQSSSARCDVQACASAYHSFRASDCTYQPFAGARRVCDMGGQQPWGGQPGQRMDARLRGAADARAQAQCNVDACARHYSSFRSLRPAPISPMTAGRDSSAQDEFSGGQRRQTNQLTHSDSSSAAARNSGKILPVRSSIDIREACDSDIDGGERSAVRLHDGHRNRAQTELELLVDDRKARRARPFDLGAQGGRVADRIGRERREGDAGEALVEILLSGRRTAPVPST